MKKRVIAWLALVTLITSLVGCGSSGASKKDEKSNNSTTATASNSTMDAYTPYKETVYFSRAFVKSSANFNYAQGDSLTNNHLTRYVKQQVNVEGTIAWEADSNSYDQKLALAITSKDIPDIIATSDKKIFKQLVENNLVEDMTEAYQKCASPFLKENYDSFKTAGDDVFTPLTTNGKLMGLPGVNIASQHNILWLRKDWLDKLGMQAPKTLQDVEAVTKAFIEKDPGGNGPGKTVGLLICEEVLNPSGNSGSFFGTPFSAYTMFANFNAYPGNWIEKDGKAVYGSIQAEMKPALQKMAQLYKDGLIDKEFAIKKGEEEKKALISSGKAGIFFGPWWSDSGIQASVANNKNAEWIAVNAPLASDGKLHIFSRDPVSAYLVVRKGYKNPEAIVKVLNAEMDIIRGNGEAGKAARLVKMKEAPALSNSVMPVFLNVDFDDALNRCITDITQALSKNDKSALKYPNNEAMYDNFVKDRDNYKKDVGVWQVVMIRKIGIPAASSKDVAVKQVVFNGVTDTMSTKWANLKKLETTMMIQVIMGEKPLSEFDDFVTKWKQMGGDQITTEVEKARSK